MEQDDVWWWVGLVVCSACLLTSIVLFKSIIEKLRAMDAASTKSLLPFTRISALSSASLNVLCILFHCSSFLVCKNLPCGYNTYGAFVYFTTMNTYIISKLFLYSLFIGRLYNEFFKQLYAYSNAILYGLCFMMLLAWWMLIAVNVLVSLHYSQYVNNDESIDSMSTIAVIIFVCLDASLSVFTLILFVIPLCSRYGHKLKLSIIKYTVLSSIAILSSTVCGTLMVYRYYHRWYHPFVMRELVYLDILNSLKCIDCIISLLCIYFGFVSKETYIEYCGCIQNCFLRLLKTQGSNDANYEVYLMNQNRTKHEPGELCLSTSSEDELKTVIDNSITITTAVSSTD
eukprot:200889_1